MERHPGKGSCVSSQLFFFSSRRRHTRCGRDWSSDVCSSDLLTFYLSFGLFLQLADDLQDIGQDYEEGSQTLFTANLGHEAEEQLVNKLLHFLYGIMDQYTSENEGFKQFLISNCYQLIYSSIAGSKEFFSQEYLDHLEQYLPVTFPYLEKMYLNRLDNIDMQNQERYIKILDELIF